MQRRRIAAVGIGTLALVASTLLATDAPDAASAATTTAATPKPAATPATADKATMQVGFTDTTAIGGLAEPVSVAFAGDGTAFIALKTGVIKSFDYDTRRTRSSRPRRRPTSPTCRSRSTTTATGG